ncbi:hypothetical protein CDAR_581291 [Caerostris darwini]|uniref:Uncharacterized protein n=1 Tax=Caerostris darwini TaxID=1538125 RepID=A0AAV4PKL6_9ARAC|nr:hypothetical protein CDAR_581291 [Caerostris darwini]
MDIVLPFNKHYSKSLYQYLCGAGGIPWLQWEMTGRKGWLVSFRGRRRGPRVSLAKQATELENGFLISSFGICKEIIEIIAEKTCQCIDLQ